MNNRVPLDHLTSDQLDQLYDDLARYDEAVGELNEMNIGLARQAARAEATLDRVTELYEQWVKAGPPPLGVPLARWWDARLVELHAALFQPTGTRATEAVAEEHPRKEQQ
jgi:DNA-binding transcriptional regulator YbjK